MDSILPTGRTLPQTLSCSLLISLDFDGTLWHEDAQPPIPVAFFELIQHWHRMGVRWGINTGRTMAYLLQDWNAYAPFLPDFICTCERFVYMAAMDGSLKALKEHNSAANTATAKLRKIMVPRLHAALKKIEAYHPELEWEIASSDPLSIEAADVETMDALTILLQPLLKFHPTVSMQRAGRYMRLADARFHKGSALAHVAEEWGVEHSRIVIIGDGHNDIDAFSHFPSAFCAAPVNAHPDVKEWLRGHGGYISPETGVMQILHHWERLYKLPTCSITHLGGCNQ